MKKVKYIGAVSPWVDTLGGSGITWTTGMESVVSDDIGDELTGYPGLFRAVAGFDGSGVTPEKVGQAGGAGGGGPTTLPVMQAAFDAGTSAEKSAFQASVSVARYPFAPQTIGVLGDSRGDSAFTYGADGQINATQPTVLPLLGYYLGGAFCWAGPDAAVPGERTDQWADGQSALLAMSTPLDFVYITYPTNDIAQSLPGFEQTKANLAAYAAAHKARGTQVIMGIGGANPTYTGAKQQQSADMRAWIISHSRANGYIVLDTFGPVVNPETGQMPTSLSADGTHENFQGANLEALAAIKNFSAITRPANFDSGWWRQLLGNPCLVGAPDAWLSYLTAGTRTKVARTDVIGGHEYLQIVFTPATDREAAGISQVINIAQAGARSTAYSKWARRTFDGNDCVCSVAGTTAATAPAFGTNIGDETIDGTAKWVRVPNIVPGVTRIRIMSECIVDSAAGTIPRIICNFSPAGNVRTHTVTGTPVMPVIDNAANPGVIPVMITPDALVPAGTTAITVYLAVEGSAGRQVTARFGRCWMIPL